MQSGAHQGLQGGGAAGHGRNPPPPVHSSSSSSPSPSSSSSGVSAPHLGLDAIQQHQQFQQQQQQHQQRAIRQSIQQQKLRKADGEETLLPYQGGGTHGIVGGNSFPSSSMPMPLLHPARKFIDLSQQQGPSQIREENQNKVQGLDQHMQNQMHQAYRHYAYQASQQQKSHGNTQSIQQAKTGIILPSAKDQEMRTNNLKMQELMSMQASTLAKPFEHFRSNEKQIEHGHTSGEQKSDLKPIQAMIGHLTTANMIRPVQASPAQSNIQNISNNQLAMMQLQAMQAWAMENNVDLTLPANANLIAQLIPLWQSRMAINHKQNESSAATVHAQLLMAKQHLMPSPSLHDYPNVNNENSVHGNLLTEVSGQVGPTKSRQTIPSASFPNSGNAQLQQIAIPNRDNQVERMTHHPITVGNGVQAMHHPPKNSVSAGPTIDSSHVKSTFSAPETLQMQYFRQLQQLNRPPLQPAVSASEGLAGQFLSQGGSLTPAPLQRIGFTKQQLHVLKAQILAFRRLKRGEGSLPQEVLRAIAPPPLNSEQVYSSPGTIHLDRITKRDVEEHVRNLETNNKSQQYGPTSKGHNLIKETPAGEVKPPIAGHAQGLAIANKDHIQIGSDGKEARSIGAIVKSEPELERGSHSVVSAKSVFIDERGKSIQQQAPTPDALQVKKSSITSTGPPLRDLGSMRKYHGPLFDSPFFVNQKFDSATVPNNMVCLAFGYDVKDLLFEEGMDVLNKKRAENLKKIGRLFAVNLDRKRIRPDLVLRLQIEERKLRLLDLQAQIRDEVDQQQQEIMAMPDRPYRKFVRLCERQRVELARQVQLSQKVMREKQLKSVFQWRKKLLEVHWAIRDARTAQNRGVAKYHERMLREFSKKKDEDRSRRMEALKNNDVDRYREMLLEQQTNMPGDAAQRYAVLSSFLSQTEDYLHKLGGKITAVKNNQEVEEAAFAAAAAAQAQGLSEEEVKTAAACAGEEVMIRNRFSEMNAPKGNSSVNKYYHLAHAVSERVVRQPSMLRAGTLRDYQLVGLQWMLSLYNNKLNGILADEMGLGKTVQVMALVAYLMEFKGNYGPHLIIVPNAVLVNWKSELRTWLPSVSCIYYVGGKDQRNKLYSQEVCAMKFNALVTTYEFVMNDKAKLAKVDWKYIIIDEAQRMKDRDSVLARDLDRYRCQRRLLLTGTPLQNDLKELWSLLNLLLPEVFDNCKAFNDWFSKPFQKDASSQSAEDDWLETEKKVIIIHRLHQILEPFMLRRRVEDVEGSLPRKDSIVLRCRMSAVQGSIYDWIKATGCLRLDPEDEIQRVQLNPNRQIRAFKTLQNRCMELRKVCNHPLLTYPYLNYFSDDFVVRCCGKLWILDRILVKLHRTGHRVLLFSTMTKLLDILEEYLQWRRLVYRRIDGGTSLEDRESAIVDFNSPDTEIFIFLLSIRAAGRGLNLQTADTVVIYDPDANPKNEEQAVARAHRIGQKREVKVIYMEAVVDKISSYQKEDELRIGGMVDSEDDLAGKDRYMGSIESLIRNNIQQYKIDMADEVINAGRFDQRTTQEERRMTLETLLHDEERYQENIHDVPSLQEVNRMIARCKEEVELFDQMDEELDWPGEMRYDEIPKWLRAGSREVDAYVTQSAKKSSKSGLGGAFGMEVDEENFSNLSPSKTGRRRGRPRGSSKKYSELDDQINYDENGEDFDESSEERNAYASEDEEEEIREFEGEDFSRAACAPPKDQLEGEGQTGGYEIFKRLEGARGKHILEEAVSSGSSSDSHRLTQIMTPTISSQKFGSLSALDARPGFIPKRMPEELEEGEIAVSGDSHMDLQQSGSWIHDRDDGEDEQVLQPTIRRKRSIRLRPRSTSERIEEKSSSEKLFLQHRNPLQLPTQPPNGYEALRTDPEHGAFKEPGIQMHGFPSRRGANSSKQHIVPKPSRLNSFSRPAEDTAEFSREDWDGKAMHSGGPVTGKMSDGIERKLKNVLSKLQKMIDKDGHKLAPLLTDFWKRNENSSYTRGLDFRKIEQSVDRLDYNGVMDFVSDVQLMLKTCVQYCGFSYEVRSDARKLQALFFDLMKAAFPDTDFREVRRLVSFSGPGTTAYPSPKQVTQSKRHKPTDEMEPELGPARLLPRGPVHIPEDFTPLRGAQLSKLQKEARVVSSGWEAGHSDEVALLTHPGDLVICKKRRKDRDKSALKTTSSVDTCRNGRDAVPKETKQIQQQLRQAAGWALTHGVGIRGVEEVQWAKPVKRMRTDTGKRRPSHL